MDTHLDICDGLHASFASKNEYEMYVLANIFKKNSTWKLQKEEVQVYGVLNICNFISK